MIVPRRLDPGKSTRRNIGSVDLNAVPTFVHCRTSCAVHLEKMEVREKVGRGGEWLERMTLEIIAVPWVGPGKGRIVTLV